MEYIGIPLNHVYGPKTDDHDYPYVKNMHRDRNGNLGRTHNADLAVRILHINVTEATSVKVARLILKPK